MNDREEKMQATLNRAAEDLSMDAGKSIKLENNPQFGYHFRITLKEEKSLRNNKNYTILDSIKGGVRFRSKKLEALNEDYMVDKNTYTDKQKEIVKEIMDTAGARDSIFDFDSVCSSYNLYAFLNNSWLRASNKSNW